MIDIILAVAIGVIAYYSIEQRHDIERLEEENEKLKDTLSIQTSILFDVCVSLEKHQEDQQKEV